MFYFTFYFPADGNNKHNGGRFRALDFVSLYQEETMDEHLNGWRDRGPVAYDVEGYLFHD